MNWIVIQAQEILKDLSHLFTAELFVIGDKHFSLGLIATLILLALTAFVVSRFISEWINRGVLARMGMSRGSREALAAVIHYLLAALGFVIVLQTAGINLSSLTVFAGVVGIGVGFGLQNLASNFISGLTLLVEQPIKVGDFIEVDDLLGTVEKISIRSTIVRTIDGVFVIVPNIRFVENNIINWSYQDPTCCIHIPVGVAYGTEPVLVTEALLSAARMESGVLYNPSPKVWFKSFGDSSLNFELLVWINEPENSDPIKSTLHFHIEHELRQRGIEIPFPQRDINIRYSEALGAWFDKDNSGEEANGKARRETTTSSSPKLKFPFDKSP
ncbi:mechanosensitive ion channel [Microcoleus sp. FACHB-SPT15]|uniref:mechanosensitive ion channel family protein n=1 Tax=Microcoleus sp. FACHB-SPT15 TaxID=2692830 RepID=UPI001786CB65|nr:mechanosensitive ion channel domain-containing protein [Microcoleus sp. FACHB-SPT15]MBD1805922.1 mechanosensitive ion channel [Microcoleus sp. FACHB-SPT15]